jgi:transposase
LSHSTCIESETSGVSLTESPNAYVGIDVGDRQSRFCTLAADSGEAIAEGRVPTTERGLERLLGEYERVVVAIEVGTHSAWIARCVRKLGHEVIVANARKLRAIYQSDKKNDRLDALMLARLARVDPQLLSPIEHRGGQAQADLAVVRARDELVRARTQLIASVRGTVKSFGQRLPHCGTETFHKVVPPKLPPYLRPALSLLVEQVGVLTARIRDYDHQLELVASRYPEVEQVRQVTGVGPITGLTYVLTIEDPTRFKSSRSVGAYLGLCPRLDDSGEQQPQLSITKSGDADLRRLLVSCAHYILGPFGPDCDLRRYGERLAERGGKNARKRAAVAVARKLSVLLLALWRSGAVYEPLRHVQRER